MFVLSYYDHSLVGDIVVSILEGYIFICFYALMIAWGWRHGNVYEALLVSEKFQNKVCSIRCCSCGPTVERGHAILWILFWQVAQLIFFKPLMALVDLIVYQNSGELSKGVKLMTSLVTLTSVVVASLAMFRVYRSLLKVHTEQEKSESKNGLLNGLHPFRKFLIIKLLVFLILLNSLLFTNLIPSAMPVPSFLCSDQSVYCQNIYLAFIFSCESIVIILPAAIFFRNSEKFFALSPTDKATHPTRQLLFQYFKFWDVWTTLLTPPESHRHYSISDIESSSSTETSQM